LESNIHSIYMIMHNISLNQEIGAVFRTNNCVVSVVINIIVVCCTHVAGA
jgi:hypothetical protein